MTDPTDPNAELRREVLGNLFVPHPDPTDPELAQRYPEVDAFAQRMRIELWANRGKGDQVGWRSATIGSLWNEIQWHSAKLAMAIREQDQQLIREYTADVANMAMMLADVAGVLPVVDPARAELVGLRTELQTDPGDCQLVRGCIGANGHGGPCVTRVERLTDELADARYETERLRAEVAALQAQLAEIGELFTVADIRPTMPRIALFKLLADIAVVVERARAAVLGRTETAPATEPEKCSNCASTWAACTHRILSGKSACCKTCGRTTTHNQDAPEHRGWPLSPVGTGWPVTGQTGKDEHV